MRQGGYGHGALGDERRGDRPAADLLLQAAHQRQVAADLADELQADTQENVRGLVEVGGDDRPARVKLLLHLPEALGALGVPAQQVNPGDAVRDTGYRAVDLRRRPGPNLLQSGPGVTLQRPGRGQQGPVLLFESRVSVLLRANN